MKKILMVIYGTIPSWLKEIVRKNNILIKIKNKLVRPTGYLKEAEVKVNKTYNHNPVSFNFIASLKVANDARKKGIENTIIRNAISLVSSRLDENNAWIFDIGGNYGFLSLVWAKTISGENGKVFYFESDPVIYNTFNKTLESNNSINNIILENMMIGNQIFDKNAEVKKFEDKVFKSSLDAYFYKNGISRCDLIKIDVDGQDFEVLQGAENVIDQFNPIIVIEQNDNTEINSFLLRKGYNLYNMQMQDMGLHDKAPNIFAVK